MKVDWRKLWIRIKHVFGVHQYRYEYDMRTTRWFPLGWKCKICGCWDEKNITNHLRSIREHEPLYYAHRESGSIVRYSGPNELEGK